MKTRTALTTAALTTLIAGFLVFPLVAQPPREGRRFNSEQMEPGEGWRAERRGPNAAGPLADCPLGGEGFMGQRAGQGHGMMQGRVPGQGFGPGGQGPGPAHGALGRLIPPRSLAPFWENDRIVEELALSPEQAAALAESLELTKQELESTRGSVGDAAQALREELKKDNPSLDTVSELADAVAAETNAKAKTILAHVATVKNILTAEQEEQLRPHGREGAREWQDLRAEIKAIIQGGGTIEDVQALLDERDLPPQLRESILRRAENALDCQNPESIAPEKGKQGGADKPLPRGRRNR